MLYFFHVDPVTPVTTRLGPSAMNPTMTSRLFELALRRESQVAIFGVRLIVTTQSRAGNFGKKYTHKIPFL